MIFAILLTLSLLSFARPMTACDADISDTGDQPKRLPSSYGYV